MANPAVTQETICALRRQIAKIEGVLPERLGTPAPDARESGAAGVVLRRAAVPAEHLLRTGVDGFDAALGGGLLRGALTEIHGRKTRDAGSVAGFALALVSLLLKTGHTQAPVLWIGTSEIFAETGLPYARGLEQLFGIAPHDLLLSEAPKFADALWIAEEAAPLKAFSAVVLELRGHSQLLDLTATRRLHRRAHDAARPVLLLRQAAEAEPTAAPVRLVVSPAPAAPRRILSGALAGSIGPPGFAVAIDKNRLAPSARFVLEWNADERSLQPRRPEHRSRPENPVAVVPLSQHGADMAPQAGAGLARQRRGPAAARHQSSG